MLANFGERHATPRILTLIVGGILSGLALLVGLLGSLLHLLTFASGGESADKFWTNEQALLPFAGAGLLGLLFLSRARIWLPASITSWTCCSSFLRS